MASLFSYNLAKLVKLIIPIKALSLFRSNGPPIVNENIQQSSQMDLISISRENLLVIINENIRFYLPESPLYTAPAALLLAQIVESGKMIVSLLHS